MTWRDPRAAARSAVIGVDFGGVMTDGLLDEGADATPIHGALEGLAQFEMLVSGRVHLISKADPKVRRLTLDWLARNAAHHTMTEDRIHFVDEDVDKAAVCRDLKVTHMIDDRIGVLRHLDTVTHRVLFGADSIPPTDAEDPLRDLHPLATWTDVVRVITRSIAKTRPIGAPSGLDVRCMSIPEARQWAQTWHPAAVLSVVNKPRQVIATDLEQLVLHSKDEAVGPRVFRPAQVERILDWLRWLSDGDRLLVHCRGGIGRSPAISCAILCATGLSPDQAWERVHDVRPQAAPNPQIIRLFDDALSLDGGLIAATEHTVSTWKPGRLH